MTRTSSSSSLSNVAPKPGGSPWDGMCLNLLHPGNNALDRELTIVSRDPKSDLEPIADTR